MQDAQKLAAQKLKTQKFNRRENLGIPIFFGSSFELVQTMFLQKMGKGSILLAFDTMSFSLVWSNCSYFRVKVILFEQEDPNIMF